MRVSPRVRHVVRRVCSEIRETTLGTSEMVLGVRDTRERVYRRSALDCSANLVSYALVVHWEYGLAISAAVVTPI